jgi:hypothetical protein
VVMDSNSHHRVANRFKNCCSYDEGENFHDEEMFSWAIPTNNSIRFCHGRDWHTRTCSTVQWLYVPALCRATAVPHVSRLG